MILDEQNVFRQDIYATYPIMVEQIAIAGKDVRDVMPAQPFFRDDKEFLPLQAADLMAGTIRRACLGDPKGLRVVDLSAVKCWPSSRVLSDEDVLRFAQAHTRQPLVNVRRPRPARKVTKKR